MRLLGKVLYLIVAAGIMIFLAVVSLNIARGTFQDHPDVPLFTKLTLMLLTLGLVALATGAGMNLIARLTRPRDDDDWGLGGIHDKVVRRYGAPTWRIGACFLVVTTPFLLLALWLVD